MRFLRFLRSPDMAPWCVFFLFLIKVTCTCIWVVRPWDVPDEVGHFAYIKDLATGKGLPVLHESRFDETVWVEFAPDHVPIPGENWIAQHPPLYHIIMVPVYWIGALFSSTIWGPFYLIRLTTAVLFGLGLVVFMKTMQTAGLSDVVSTGLGLMLASIPNHTFLAGAVNHDALVFLCGSFVLFYWVRFSQSKSRGELIWLGLILGLGGVVKYTFLVLYTPLVLLVIYSLYNEKKLSGKQMVCFLLTVFIPIGIWMIRNCMVVGALLPVDTTGFQSDTPLVMSFVQFGREFPVFSIIMQSYWGLLGWMGDQTLNVRWLNMYSIYQQAYSWPLVLLMLITLFYLIKNPGTGGRGLCFRILGTLTVLYVLQRSGWLGHQFRHFIPLFFIGVVIVGWNLSELSIRVAERNLDTARFIEIGAMCIFLFFLAAHFYKVYSYSLPSGALQGTFGRYYLPVVGFFVLGFLGRGLKRFPWAASVVMISAIVYSCAEFYVWLHEAIPFFTVHG